MALEFNYIYILIRLCELNVLSLIDRKEDIRENAEENGFDDCFA